MANAEQFWNSPRSVAEYGARPFLFRGEQLAFAAGVAGPIRDTDVLDLACGGGRTTYFLRDGGARVIGVDIAEKLIETARRHFPDIDFRVGDATALEFGDNSFDLVLVAFNSLDAIYPKQARLAAMAEIRRVLRPGGRLLFSVHNLAAVMFGWYRMMAPAKLAHRLGQVLQGNVFKSECYLPEKEIPGMQTYYAWPGRIIAETRAAGFEWLGIYPNDPILAFLHRTLHTTWLTRLCDPWPYFAFRKLR